MTSVNSYSSVSVALNGLRQADQALVAAVEAVGSGSLDADTMAQAAAILQGAEMQAGASAVALRAGLGQQRHLIDILA
jgi:hypothetical protein